MGKPRKKTTKTETPTATTTSGRERPLEQMTFRVCENPQPFETVLDVLADLLIDLAERDGTIKPTEGTAVAA